METDVTFTEDELYALLIDAARVDVPDIEPGTVTTGDVMERFGMSRYRAARLLKKLANDGKLTTAWVVRANDWGISKPVPGYRLVAH